MGVDLLAQGGEARPGRRSPTTRWSGSPLGVLAGHAGAGLGLHVAAPHVVHDLQEHRQQERGDGGEPVVALGPLGHVDRGSSGSMLSISAVATRASDEPMTRAIWTVSSSSIQPMATSWPMVRSMSDVDVGEDAVAGPGLGEAERAPEPGDLVGR